MRGDVLELMAEEIAGRPVDPLASFVSWTTGARRLDGMRRGLPLELPDDADLRALAALVRSRRYDRAHKDQRRERLKAWREKNPDLATAQRARHWKKHRDEILPAKRERGRAAYREKIGHEPARPTDPRKLGGADLAKIGDPGNSVRRLVSELGVSDTTIKRWRRRAGMSSTLSVGDAVTMRAGTARARTGRIVAVVPAGKLPVDCVPPKWRDQVDFRGQPRPCVSYVVMSAGVLCWPRPGAVGKP